MSEEERGAAVRGAVLVLAVVEDNSDDEDENEDGGGGGDMEALIDMESGRASSALMISRARTRRGERSGLCLVRGVRVEASRALAGGDAKLVEEEDDDDEVRGRAEAGETGGKRGAGRVRDKGRESESDDEDPEGRDKDEDKEDEDEEAQRAGRAGRKGVVVVAPRDGDEGMRAGEDVGT